MLNDLTLSIFYTSLLFSNIIGDILYLKTAQIRLSILISLSIIYLSYGFDKCMKCISTISISYRKYSFTSLKIPCTSFIHTSLQSSQQPVVILLSLPKKSYSCNHTEYSLLRLIFAQQYEFKIFYIFHGLKTHVLLLLFFAE